MSEGTMTSKYAGMTHEQLEAELMRRVSHPMQNGVRSGNAAAIFYCKVVESGKPLSDILYKNLCNMAGFTQEEMADLDDLYRHVTAARSGAA